MIFVGRIHPIKNLDYLLTLLSSKRPGPRLTVVGSLEDKAFWENCVASLRDDHIRVEYAGEKPNHQLRAGHYRRAPYFSYYRRRGENFGHAIFEAMAAGRPVT